MASPLARRVMRVYWPTLFVVLCFDYAAYLNLAGPLHRPSVTGSAGSPPPRAPVIDDNAAQAADDTVPESAATENGWSDLGDGWLDNLSLREPNPQGSSSGAGARTVTDHAKPGASGVGRTRNAGPRSVTAVVTAYSDRGLCSDQRPAGPGRVAAPRWIPLGSRAYITGYGHCVVADRTNARLNGRWDVWFPTERQCLRVWGKRTIRVTYLRRVKAAMKGA
jgi:3D (Asp-Asp-Asp) domain-containing protein